MSEHDIKARLREAANAHGLVSADLIRGIFQDSLARIEALEGRPVLETEWEQLEAANAALKARIEALEAERDRLREAIDAFSSDVSAVRVGLPCPRCKQIVRLSAPPAAPAEEGETR